jgi:uncharacterized protein YndB with AHSA1/START domain
MAARKSQREKSKLEKNKLEKSNRADTSRAESQATREILITRVFAAPRELVFKAWIEPARMAQWWGPRGYTNPVCEMEAKPGGTLRMVMRAPNGMEHPMTAVFDEVVEPERLVFTAVARDAQGNALLEARTTVTFAEHAGGTKITVQASAVACADQAVAMLAGMQEGWTQSLQKLDDVITGVADRQIVMTRVLDAPRELVFKAWTDPDRIGQWWGPNGFTTTTHEMDFRPGGVWRHIMHGPDGTDYDNEIVYVEIVKPERIVYDHVSDPRFRSTATFTECNGKTLLAVQILFESATLRETVIRQFGAAEGLQQTLQRLGVHMAGRDTRSADRPFLITRTFDAPRELVFKAWTDPRQLAHWFGPKGVTITKCEMDLRPGGTFHYCMHTPDGQDMWGKWVFREIVAPEKIVLISSFSDAQGNMTRHPMSQTWPLEMLSTTTFIEHDGKTILTIEWAPMNATELELETFNAAHAGMQQGWTGSLDALADYLSKL